MLHPEVAERLMRNGNTVWKLHCFKHSASSCGDRRRTATSSDRLVNECSGVFTKLSAVVSVTNRTSKLAIDRTQLFALLIQRARGSLLIKFMNGFKT